MVNLAGAAKGALSGGAAGSLFGPWGLGIGAGVGGISGLLSGDTQNDRLEKVASGTPGQERLHSNTLSQAMGMSQGNGGYQQAQNYYNRFLGNNQQQAFDQFSAPYLQNFEEQILPQIAERFAGAGALSSSGFGQALGGASASLQSQLAQLFSQLQSQSAGAQTNQYNQLTQTGLNYEPFQYTKNKGSIGLGDAFSAGLSDPKNMEGIIKGIMSLFSTKAPENGGIR